MPDIRTEIDALIVRLTKKHGNSGGTQYEQGVSDHGIRLRCQIKMIFDGYAKEPGMACDNCPAMRELEELRAELNGKD